MNDNAILPRWIDISCCQLSICLPRYVWRNHYCAYWREPVHGTGGNAERRLCLSWRAWLYAILHDNFIFTGLAVAVAFHAMLFNIGGEGQAMMGELGVGLVALALDPFLPPVLVVLLGICAAAALGGLWGVIPGWLQARRGSHIVITTIMFNFIASSVMVWLLAGMLMNPGQMSPETRSFAEVGLAQIHVIAGWLGIEISRSPLNLSFPIALIVSVGVVAYLAYPPWLYYQSDRP